MDSVSSSRTRDIKLLNLTLTPYDLSRIKDLAHTHYTQNAGSDATRSFVAGLNQWLNQQGYSCDLKATRESSND